MWAVCGTHKVFRRQYLGERHAHPRQLRARHPTLAPACENYGVGVIGHGVEAGGHFYCCAQYATMVGAEGSPAGRGHTNQLLVRGSRASMGLRGAGLLSRRS